MGYLIQCIMKIVEDGPMPDKAPEAVINARLEILGNVIDKYGINSADWDWATITENLLIQSLLNKSADVKEIAIQVITKIFLIVGQPVRELVNDPKYNLNPLLL